jgi:DNA-binding LacI/PurR family transcriptional regulator
MNKQDQLGKSDTALKELRLRIQNGVYDASDFLPPERVLAGEFGISRPTLRKALAELVREGWLVSRAGAGTRVAQPGAGRISVQKQPWRVIAFLVPDITSRFFVEVTEAIEYTALQRGFNLLLCSSRRQLSLEQNHLRQLAERDVNGVIIAHDHVGEFPDNIHLLEQARIPFVLMFNVPTRADFDTVVVDNRSGVGQVMRYLLSLGHRRIAFCKPVVGPHLHPREQLFREYAQANKLALPERYVLSMEEPEEAASREQIGALFAGPDPPTAIFAGNDRVALVLLKHLNALGVRVPEDVSVIGFDNLGFTEHLAVPLTTVDQPKREMGRRAAEMLIEQIEMPASRPPLHEVFQPRLVIRNSCAMVPPGPLTQSDVPPAHASAR